MENIAVVLRVRPILTSERKHGDASCIEVVGEGKKKVQVKVNPTKTDYYKCIRCFARDTSQAQLFYESGMTNLIDVAMKGNDVCVYSYGESSSGKTFTLFGTPKRVGAKEKQSGLILRSLRYIFEKLYENNIKVQLRLSSVEIKGEQVFDLFVPVDQRSPLVLQEDELDNTNILDLTKIKCTSYASASEILEEIIQNRCVRQETDSHCLTEIHISIPLQNEDHSVTYVPLGKISFVDLMNSATLHGNQHSEEHAVDNSLHVITHVIDGIEHEDNNDISVMDSVLSKLLSRCVGVRGRSLLVACVCEAKLNVEETLRTLKFSCKPAPKQPKYLDPQAKLVYDLKKELHVLSHRNRQLRATIIEAPTWELHALSHSSPKAMKQEIADEKALIAMHNEILKANETYTFKPRTGGRMYFPSPVAGREIPIKPTKKYLNERELLKSGGFLENSSLFSGYDTESQSLVATGADGSVLPGEVRPTTSSSQVHREISIHTVEDVMRRQGTTGPLVFKIKREPGMETVDPATRVKQVLPLRSTTRLGFGRAGKDWEQSDWPAEIRKRVADKEARDALLVEAGTIPKASGPMFTWKPEDPVESPFVAHLTTKPPPELPERPAFTVHNWPCSTFSDPESDPRPVTAPSARRPYHPYQDTRPHSHTSTSENATTATDGLTSGVTPDVSRPSTGRVHRKHSKSRTHSHSSETTHTGAGDSESLEHTAATTTYTSVHSEHHLTSEEAADAALIASLHSAPDESAPGFNPLKPSVFAASLMSDQSNLTRRHSTVESLAAFASSMTHIDITANKLASVVEEEAASSSGKVNRGTKTAPKLKHMYRQNSGRSRHSADSDSINSGGRMSSKSNSFSSLPAVDGVAPALQQKSKSIRSIASSSGSGRF